MITLILLNLCFIAFIYKFYLFVVARPDNFPPGPPKLPWLGSYLFMLLSDYNHMHKATDRLCKFYNTNILGLYLGTTPMIVLNDEDKVKRALNHRDFDGRPDLLLARLRDPHFDRNGIFFKDGDAWVEQRRFTLRYLRDYGFGRRFDELEHEIAFQIGQYIDLIKNGPKYPHEHRHFDNGKIRLPFSFAPVFANSFISVVFNQAIPRENMAKLGLATESTMKFQRNGETFGRMFSLIPELANWFPKKSAYNATRESSMEIYNFFKGLIDEQIQTYDDSHDRHFVDMYIRKMNEQDDPASTFSYEQFVMSIVDFGFPPFSALSTTMTFMVQLVCHKPEIQRKVQEEIDRVVGEGRLPTLDDRVNLHYTEATLREIMRYETLTPSSLAHRALVDTQFDGYDIPAGTFVITSLGASHHDPLAWQHPNEFQPERFLDKNGRFCVQKDKSLPFGAGKRLCAGETFARNMLFLFMAAFFQAFSVSMPDGVKPQRFDQNKTGLIRHTADHWVQVTVR